jgi:hypothetical protein
LVALGLALELERASPAQVVDRGLVGPLFQSLRSLWRLVLLWLQHHYQELAARLQCGLGPIINTRSNGPYPGCQDGGYDCKGNECEKRPHGCQTMKKERVLKAGWVIVM